MAKGDCKRRVVRFAKRGAAFLGPVLGALIPQLVSSVELLQGILPGAFGGHEKRQIVYNAIKAEAKKIGHEAYDAAKDEFEWRLESYTRAALESALENLRAGLPLEELQKWVDSPELLEADTD